MENGGGELGNMANNQLDVNINVKMNGSEAIGQISEIKGSISNMSDAASKNFKKVSESADKSGSGLKSAFSKGLDGVSGKIKSISESFSGLNGVMSSVMGTIGLNSFKSMTLDMAMARDQSKNLMAVVMQGNSTWAEAQQTANSFMSTIKEGTSGSVVKFQMMIDAMNGIKLSTGMANSDLESLNDVIRKVGEASILMGDDTEHATYVMKEAMAGLNGDFTVLKEQFGITKEKMMDAGWSGAADDVQGYRQALEQCMSGLGDMGQVMDTTSGKLNKIKSNFSSAGLEIGNQMMPAVDWLASAFLDANENGNILAKGILYVGGAASMFASLAPTLKPMIDTLQSVGNAASGAKKFLFDAPEGGTSRWTKLKNAVSGAKKSITGLFGEEGKLRGVKSAVSSSWSKLRETVTKAKSSITGLFGEEGKLQGVKSSIQSGWKTLTSSIGKAKDAVSNFGIASKLSSAAGTIKSGITAGWTALTGVITGTTAATNANTGSNAANTASEGGSTIAKYAHAVAEGVRTTAVNIATAAQTALAAATWASVGPILLVVAAIAAFVAILAYLYFNNETVRNSINALVSILQGALMGAWNALSGAISAVANILQSTLGPAINFIMLAFQVLSSTVGQIIDVFSRVMDGSMSLGDAFNAIGGILSNAGTLLWNAAVAAGQQMLEGFKTSVGQAIDGAKTAVGGFIDSVVQFFSELPGKVAGALGGLGGSILSGLGNAIGQVRTGILDFMGGIADALSGLSNLPVIGPVFDGLAGSVRTAAGVFSILSSAVIGIVNVFSGLLSGTMSVGDAFNALGNILGSALSGVQTLIGNFISNIVSGFMGIGQRILQGFLNIPQMLGQFFMLAVQQIQVRLTQARAIAGMLVQMLVHAVVTRFTQLVARVRMVFTNVVNAIRNRLTSARTIASNLANLVRNAIVTRFNRIIAQARTIFQRIVNTIKQRLANAVTAAKDKAQEILQGIKDKVSQIPQMVADEFNKIKDRIATALDNAKNVAVQKIGDLVAAVKGALGIASPGFIQRMMAFEFESIPNIIADNSVLAINEAARMASGIVDTWDENMQTLAMGGVLMNGVTPTPNQSLDLFQNNPLMQGMNSLGALTMNYEIPRTSPNIGGREIIQNNSTDDHQTHIHIENIQLDCNHLTKQESRKILYDALDGLYTGGV